MRIAVLSLSKDEWKNPNTVKVKPFMAHSSGQTEKILNL
jgi:hypothetical protein